MSDKLDIVKLVYDNFALGDLPAALTAFDPDIVWNEASGYPSVGGRHVGVPAVVEVLKRVVGEWPDLAVTPAEFFTNGERVVVLGEVGGTHAATGKSFRSPFAHAWTLRESWIVEWRAYVDTALARDAAKP
jgi:uncharacterized protein